MAISGIVISIACIMEQYPEYQNPTESDLPVASR